MIPLSILRPALAAQEAHLSEDIKWYQMKALAAAWRWGLQEFKKKPRNLWLSHEESSKLWIGLAGEEPLVGHRKSSVTSRNTRSDSFCGEGILYVMA